MESAKNGLNPKADLQYLIVNSISELYTQQISTQQIFHWLIFVIFIGLLTTLSVKVTYLFDVWFSIELVL